MLAILLSTIAVPCTIGTGYFIYKCIKNTSSGQVEVNFDIEPATGSTSIHTQVEQITQKVEPNEEFKFKVKFSSENFTIGELEIKMGEKILSKDDYTIDYEECIITIKPNVITENFTVKMVEQMLSTKVMINGIGYAPIGLSVHYEGVVLGGDDETPIENTSVTWELISAPAGVKLDRFTGQLTVPLGTNPDEEIKIQATAADLNQAQSDIKIIKTKTAVEGSAIGVIAWENTKMTLVNVGNNNPDLQYSTDFETWKKVNADERIEIPKGSSILLKGDNINGFSKSATQYSTIHFITDTSIGGVELVGNVMSLLDNGAGTTRIIPCDYCFTHLFSIANVEPFAGGTKSDRYNHVQYVPLDFLPATTLTKGCYSYMFNSSDLTFAPLLPATTVTEECYLQMFVMSDQLKSAAPLYHVTNDVLPARCYKWMYSGCEKLNVVEGTAYPYSYYLFTCPYTEQQGTDSIFGMFKGTKLTVNKGTPLPGKKYGFII